MVGLLTPAQASKALGISDRQLRELTDDGALPFINVGRGEKRLFRRYDPADIEAFKAARRRIECRSTSARAQTRTDMISSSGAIDLSEILAQRTNAKREKSRSGYGGRNKRV